MQRSLTAHEIVGFGLGVSRQEHVHLLAQAGVSAASLVEVGGACGGIGDLQPDGEHRFGAILWGIGHD